MATTYATPADLGLLGLPTTVLASASTPQAQGALDTAASEMDDVFLQAGYVVPLAPVSDRVRQCCVRLASGNLLDGPLGAFKDDPSVSQVNAQRDYWRAWLKLVWAGVRSPLDTDAC